MSRRVVGTVAIVGVVGAVVMLGAIALGRADADGSAEVERTTPDPVTSDRVFDVVRGDPINVVPRRGTGTTRCIAISGTPYLSSSFCPERASIRAGGAYTVMSPVEGDAPPLVVGFLPSGASRAVVTVGDSKALGESRGPLFLVVLAPGALGPEADETATVEFG